MLLALALVTVFYALGRADVITDNEGQRATPPAEMVRSGDYLIPTINGVDYLVKPPLLYWAIAGLYKATGTISPFIARIPTALCGALLVIAVYLAFRKEAGEHTARWAAFALLASPYALERMRWAELDIPLTLAVFLCVAAFRTAVLRESVRERTLWTLGAGLAFGAAILLKGPVPFLFLWVAAVALLIAQGQDAGRVVRTGLVWSAVALAVELMSQAAAALVPAHAKLLGTPIELTAMLLLWTALAWRNGGRVRSRAVGIWLAIMVVGVAVSAPWGLAVLYQKGWPYISEMLHNQVVERTYVASRINGGTPFYFLIALPAMLAPWGLLLPLHFSKGQWKARPGVYHFGAIMGWLSVLMFSLIAGKEYEYILPCIPFLLLPTAFHLAAESETLTQKWVARWLTVWRAAFAVLLPVAALAGAVYLTATEPIPSLLLLVWPLAVLAAVAGALSFVTPRGRTITIFSAALCLILMGLIVRDDRATRDMSPRELAQLCGELVHAGYTVEAAKVYPAFAFYAATPIPVNISPEDIRNKLESDTPFYYLIRESDYRQFLLNGGEIANAKIVAGPYGFKKDMMLVGNAELPE
ncbi:MAG: glycosyltransferase family 39 protein [Candidatus Hydrogenedentes bacterium]|nr:glycosyltransferase family 39 protein [Candidatus Hydrogenedentota bacterium]